jgi:hypothetical protein
MKGVKLLGLMVVLILVMGYLPLGNLVVSGQVSEEVEVYREILIRVLGIPGIDTELRNRIEVLLDMDITTPEAAEEFLAEARAILSEVSTVVEREMDLTLTIEEGELELIIESSLELATEANALELSRNLSLALQLLEEGDLEGAKELVGDLLDDVGELRAIQSAVAVERAVVGALDNIPPDETAVEAILRAISNINRTMDILAGVVETLMETNASEEAILAVSMAIELLNQTSSILDSVATLVNMTGIPERALDITLNVVFNRIAEKALDLREEIEELESKIVAIEVTLNLSLDNERELLLNASILLDEVEAYISAGNMEEAMRLITHVEVLVDRVESMIDVYEDALEEHAEAGGYLPEFVLERFNDLEEEYNHNLEILIQLYNIAVQLNLTMLIDVLVEANATMADVSVLIDEISVLIDNEEYSEALTLISMAEAKLEYVENLLDNIRDVVGTAHEVIGEISEKLDDLREEIEELRETVLTELSGPVLDVAIEKLDELNETLSELYAMMAEGRVRDVGEDISKALETLELLEEMLYEIIEYVDEVDSLRARIMELREIHEGIVDIQFMLDNADELLNLTISIMVDALVNMDMELLVEAGQNLELALEIVSQVEERGVERHLVRFVIVDLEDTSVATATILLDGQVFGNGDTEFLLEGTYTISVGSLPEGYAFVEWRVEGDIEIEDSSAATTTIEVHGEGVVILVLEKTGGEEQVFTVTFYIYDTEGNVIYDATILFNGEEVGYGDVVEVAVGEYTLEVGSLPEGYIFVSWSIEGGASVDNPFDPETSVEISGNVVITMIIQKVQPSPVDSGDTGDTLNLI